jgi:hypothetical protein
VMAGEWNSCFQASMVYASGMEFRGMVLVQTGMVA